MNGTEPTQNRHEKLRRALAQLERGGVTGAHAYGPAFRSLARAGYILRPLHYWSFLGLTALGFFMLVVLIGGTVAVSLTVGFVPRAVHRVMSAGPVVFLGVSLALALVFAAVHKIKARRINLPKWRDL